MIVLFISLVMSFYTAYTKLYGGKLFILKFIISNVLLLIARDEMTGSLIKIFITTVQAFLLVIFFFPEARSTKHRD